MASDPSGTRVEATVLRTVGPPGSLFELLLPPGMRVLSGELAEVDRLPDDIRPSMWANRYKPAHRRQPVDTRGRQAAIFHARSVELDVGTPRVEDGEVVVTRPLEEHPKVLPVRVERPPAIARQERDRRQLGLVEAQAVGERRDCRRGRLECRHGCPPSSWEGQRTPRA